MTGLGTVGIVVDDQVVTCGENFRVVEHKVCQEVVVSCGGENKIKLHVTNIYI